MAVRIDEAALFRKVDYAPHKKQRLVHAAKANHRFRVISAGRRWGKSQTGGHDLTTAAARAFAARDSLEPHGKRHEYWIVGPEYTDAEKEFRVVYNDLKHLGFEFDKPGTYYDSNGGNMHISLFGGRFLIHAKSAKYPETLVGEGLMGVELVEAAKLKPVVWTKYIRPTLADYASEGSWASMTSTPEGKNWFYREWQRGQDPNDSEYWSLRSPSWENNILFPAGRGDSEILSMERGMAAEKFKQEVEADFTDFVGRVYKDFDEETHVGDFPYNPNLPLYIAQDVGFTNPTVLLFLQVDHWDNVKVIAEYYQRQRTISEVIRDVRDNPRLRPLTEAARTLYPDPADPGPATEMSQAWRVGVASGTGGTLGSRIDLIRRWLAPWPPELPEGHKDKVPRLMFDRSCLNAISEMQNYRYPDTKNEQALTSENPLKVDDHAPEALSRFFAGHYGQRETQQRRSRVATGRIKR